MTKLFFLALAGAALIFAIGSAGAFAAGGIGFLQFALQVGIAAIVEWISYMVLN